MTHCPYCDSLRVEKVGCIQRHTATNPVYSCLACDEIWEIKKKGAQDGDKVQMHKDSDT